MWRTGGTGMRVAGFRVGGCGAEDLDLALSRSWSGRGLRLGFLALSGVSVYFVLFVYH